MITYLLRLSKAEHGMWCVVRRVDGVDVVVLDPCTWVVGVRVRNDLRRRQTTQEMQAVRA